MSERIAASRVERSFTPRQTRSDGLSMPFHSLQRDIRYKERAGFANTGSYPMSLD